MTLMLDPMQGGVGMISYNAIYTQIECENHSWDTKHIVEDMEIHQSFIDAYITQTTGIETALPEIEITQPVESNGVFARVPTSIIPRLQQEFFFYVWDENQSIVRWMTSWDTTPEDIDRFCLLIKQLVR